MEYPPDLGECSAKPVLPASMMHESWERWLMFETDGTTCPTFEAKGETNVTD